MKTELSENGPKLINQALNFKAEVVISHVLLGGNFDCLEKMAGYYIFGFFILILTLII